MAEQTTTSFYLFSFSHCILNDVDTSKCKAMISMIKATCFFYAYCIACSRFGFSLLYCYFIFCYLMLHLYFLFVLIRLLLHAYNDFCLTACCWQITSHKSIPDLKIDPSRVTVKLSSATFGIPSRHPSFPFWGFKGPEGSILSTITHFITFQSVLNKTAKH